MISLQEAHELCVENSTIIAVIFLLLVWYLNRKYGFNLMETNTQDANNYCDDENCVRCNKYNSTSARALKLLSSVKDKATSFKIQKGLDFVRRPFDEFASQKPNVFYYDNLTAINIWNKKQKQQFIDDCSLLEKSHDVILEEYSDVLEAQMCGTWKRNRTPRGSWDVFHLMNQGDFVPENVAVCPKTTAIISSVSSMMLGNVFGNVMFSVLKPGTKISPHYGPTNIRLRCHLGIKTTPQCSLTVDGFSSTWEDGKCLVFDDSFLHSVNHSGEVADEESANHELTITDNVSKDRIVLIVDLWHPDLSLDEREAINTCFHP